MPSQDDAYLRHQQTRWLRPDAHRWLRPDAARWYAPGTKLESVFPALALKYSPNQPRVPSGNPDGGQWTDGDGGSSAGASSSGRPRVIIDTTDLDKAPRDDTRDEIDSLGLFGITPREREPGGVQLAGDLPDGLGGPKEEPPEIPKQRLAKSWERTAAQRAMANWLVRNSITGEAALGAIKTYEWLEDYQDSILAARDPAKTLEELQSDLDPRPGYDRHHIVEKTWAQYWGFTKDDTEDPDNLVMIPRLKHYQITGWYGTKNDRYGGLSPREYLRDKDWYERRQVGLDALELFGILKR